MSLMTMNESGTLVSAKLAEALAKAQGKIKNPGKDHTADIKSDKGRYTYKYSTLSDGLDAIRAALSENGLAVTQTTDFEGDLIVLYTRLLHSSGEWVGSRWPVGSFARMTPQQTGSALTYARRYSLYSIVGISGTDEDDDGKAASEEPKTISAVPPAPPVPPKRIPPKDWMLEAHKLYQNAQTREQLHSAHAKVSRAFHFNTEQQNQLNALLLEEAAKFEEMNENG